MTGPSPAPAKILIGECGRAVRYQSGGGAELWQFPSSERARAERLTRLGAKKIGGFRAHSAEAEWIWLERSSCDRSLGGREALGDAAWPFRAAVALAVELAHALDT